MSSNKNSERRAGGFFKDKGLYLVLLLCVAAVGVSGYLLLTPAPEEPVPTVDIIKKPTDGPVTTLPDVSTVILSPSRPSEKPVEKPEEREPAIETAKPVGKKYIMPVTGQVIRNFSNYELIFDETMADWRTHNGADLACEAGTQVRAMDAGMVEKVYYDELNGGVVEISHADGYYSVYRGLESMPPVSVGDSLAAGDLIGVTAGMKLESLMPPHLHWEVLKDGVFKDPLSLPFK